MPRLFYQAVVGLAFAMIGIALLGVETLVCAWLVDRYPNPFAWAAFAFFLLVDVPIGLALWEAAVRNTKRA